MSDQNRSARPTSPVSVVCYGLSPLFVCVGLAKLWGPQMLADQFAAWDLAPSVMYMVGVVEVIAGFLLLMPSARAIGAVLLAIIMIGAGITHFFAQQFAAIAVPAVIFVLLGWITISSPLSLDEPEAHDDAAHPAH